MGKRFVPHDMKLKQAVVRTINLEGGKKILNVTDGTEVLGCHNEVVYKLYEQNPLAAMRYFMTMILNGKRRAAARQKRIDLHPDNF